MSGDARRRSELERELELFSLNIYYAVVTDYCRPRSGNENIVELLLP
jgi:hypothetical protein